MTNSLSIRDGTFRTIVLEKDHELVRRLESIFTTMMMEKTGKTWITGI